MSKVNLESTIYLSHMHMQVLGLFAKWVENVSLFVTYTR